MKGFWNWVTLSTVLLGGAAVANDLDAVIADCNGCHGDNGVSQWSDMPTIAGIDAFTHADALYVFRDSDRPCEDSEYRQGDTSKAATNMCDVAADLDDDTIEALAEHYAALPFVPAKQDFDAALAAEGETIHDRDCTRCHSDGGSNPEDEAGILSGQWMDYMRRSFKDYASGERDQLEKMQVKMDELSDTDVEALLHYYASQQ